VASTESRPGSSGAGALGLLVVLFSLGGSLCAYGGYLWPSAITLLLACALLIRFGVRFGGSWATLLVVFLFFHAVYGLSGPFAVLSGGYLPGVFSPPFRVGEFLAALGLGTAALCVGLSVVMVLVPAGCELFKFLNREHLGSPRAGIAVIGLGSAMELTNCVRAGGWRLIVLGKAVYQSQVDALVLTLPASGVVALGLAILTLSMARRPGERRPGLSGGEVFMLLLAAAPILLITLALGYRGPMMEWFLVGVLGWRYFNPLPRLGTRAVGVFVALYLASGLVYSNRAIIGYGLLTGDWGRVLQLAATSERLLLALNPAGTEFGAAFGNYSEYLNRASVEPSLGETYVRGLATPIPGFLYPGKKPQQVAYEFRDRLFPGLAREGTIAGTAYSSLLESFVNFGTGGAFAVYLVVGLVLGLVDRWRWRTKSVALHLLYLLLGVQAVAFHRSDLSSVMAGTMLSVVIVFTYLSVRFVVLWLAAGFSPSQSGQDTRRSARVPLADGAFWGPA